MSQKLFRTIKLSVIILILFSCNAKGKDPRVVAKSPDTKPAYGKVKIDLSDTNSPVYKSMIFSLDTFYQKQVAAGFNGSVLIGYKGKIIYERYFGLSNRAMGTPWDKTTQSQLASTSKTLTSGAILLLKDKGLLAFDDLVTKYLPSFPYSNITVRMLLNHRSGLPDYIKFAPKPKDKTFLTNDDVVNLFASKKPSLQFTPNTKFRYSNSNYAFLASIVESVTGMKFPYFMKRFIFNPLGMNDTFVFDPNEERACTQAFCYNYSWSLEPDMHLDGVWGDKGTYSSVRDLYKWDQALYTNKLIKYSTIQEAYRAYSPDMPATKNYGLGWRMINQTDGTKIIFHNGWWHGNNTCFFRFIQDNFTIIVLGNRFNKSIYKQPQKIYNIVMNDTSNHEEIDTEE
jgi:CubicO group peptidase (beta-lactamase class C family)